jgi:adenine-specific DNA-methyltransferase
LASFHRKAAFSALPTLPVVVSRTRSNSEMASKRGQGMSRLTDLLRQVEGKDEQLAADLRREFEVLSKRRAFGLNFERHVPETVELPGRPVRRGDKVRFLPEGGADGKDLDRGLWTVARVRREKKARIAELVRKVGEEKETETAERDCEDLVVVAEFRDPIYPGLKSTGRVERGGDKPFHTVINAENYHALQALLYTHEGKVDAIYIDPPYNTGAKDWKYNNDYVDGEDAYRHSKWLAMMERRLKLAKRLLNPENSVLIVTIDEKEYLRLGLLLKQIFPETKSQMVTTVISQNGTSREGEFSRVEEFLFLHRIGSQGVIRTNDNMLSSEGKGIVKRTWFNFLRTSTPREDLEGQFYPIVIDTAKRRITRLGEPAGKGNSPVDPPLGATEVAVWPIRADGSTATWGAIPETAQAILESGFMRVGGKDKKTGRWNIHYVREGDRRRIEDGIIKVALPGFVWVEQFG